MNIVVKLIYKSLMKSTWMFWCIKFEWTCFVKQKTLLKFLIPCKKHQPKMTDNFFFLVIKDMFKSLSSLSLSQYL